MPAIITEEDLETLDCTIRASGKALAAR